jgi:serine/threonine protein kinase
VYQKLELVQPVTTVFECQDPNFNELRSSDNAPNDKKEWLWRFWGRLLILEVPYYEGRHFAESPSELLSVVKWLIELHEAGYVHGDIRPFNVIFHQEKSCLIDLDLGGKLADGPIYPVGYVWNVDDIQRLGRAGEPITKRDDWYALLMVIFHRHAFSPVGTGFADLTETERRLRDQILVELLTQDDLSDQQSKELLNFLEKVKELGWQVGPNSPFVLFLKTYGHYPLRTNCAVSTVGTGTPPKK